MYYLNLKMSDIDRAWVLSLIESELNLRLESRWMSAELHEREMILAKKLFLPGPSISDISISDYHQHKFHGYASSCLLFNLRAEAIDNDHFDRQSKALLDLFYPGVKTCSIHDQAIERDDDFYMQGGSI